MPLSYHDSMAQTGCKTPRPMPYLTRSNNSQPMATPESIAADIVSAAQEKAAEISATGSYAAIQDGYRACSALVLRLAIESAIEAHPDDESLQVEHLDEILQALENNTPGKDKKAIVNQISDLLQQLVD